MFFFFFGHAISLNLLKCIWEESVKLLELFNNFGVFCYSLYTKSLSPILRQKKICLRKIRLKSCSCKTLKENCYSLVWNLQSAVKNELKETRTFIDMLWSFTKDSPSNTVLSLLVETKLFGTTWILLPKEGATNLSRQKPSARWD